MNSSKRTIHRKITVDNSGCANHTDFAVKIEHAQNTADNAITRIDNCEKFAKDIHDDHEKTKEEISKIKISFATASFVGSGTVTALFKGIEYLIKNPESVKNTTKTAMIIWKSIFPDSYAGN